MAEITAASVKELRERTGAGMMDCKKALAENNGEMEASVDWLRAKGLAAAAKKAGRTAAEGRRPGTSAPPLGLRACPRGWIGWNWLAGEPTPHPGHEDRRADTSRQLRQVPRAARRSFH